MLTAIYNTMFSRSGNYTPTGKIKEKTDKTGPQVREMREFTAELPSINITRQKTQPSNTVRAGSPASDSGSVRLDGSSDEETNRTPSPQQS